MSERTDVPTPSHYCGQHWHDQNTGYCVLQVKRGVLYSSAEAEGRRKRNPFDTVTEGVGLNRLTENFALACIDDAVQCTDQVLLAFVLLGLRAMNPLHKRCCCAEHM